MVIVKVVMTDIQWTMTSNHDQHLSLSQVAGGQKRTLLRHQHRPGMNDWDGKVIVGARRDGEGVREPWVFTGRMCRRHVPFEFVGKVASTGAMAEASDIEGSSRSRHGAVATN
jgi:hypothetical protein